MKLFYLWSIVAVGILVWFLFVMAVLDHADGYCDPSNQNESQNLCIKN